MFLYWIPSSSEAWRWEKQDVAIWGPLTAGEVSSMAPCEGAGPPDYEVSSSKWCLSSSSVIAQQLHVKVTPVYHLPRLLSLKTIMYFVGVPPLDADDLSGYCPSISVLIEPEIRVPHFHLLYIHNDNCLISIIERPLVWAWNKRLHWNANQAHSQQCLWLMLCFLLALIVWRMN